MYEALICLLTVPFFLKDSEGASSKMVSRYRPGYGANAPAAAPFEQCFHLPQGVRSDLHGFSVSTKDSSPNMAAVGELLPDTLLPVYYTVYGRVL